MSKMLGADNFGELFHRRFLRNVLHSQASEDWLRDAVPPRGRFMARASLNYSSQLQVEGSMRLSPSLVMSSSQDASMPREAQCPQLAHADRVRFFSGSRQATGTLAFVARQSFANREVIGRVHSDPREQSLGVADHCKCKSTFRPRRKRNLASTVLFVTAARQRQKIKSRLMRLPLRFNVCVSEHLKMSESLATRWT